MTHIDVFRGLGAGQRTASTSRGVYRLTLSSLDRLVRLAKHARFSYFWNRDDLITHTDYTV